MRIVFMGTPDFAVPCLQRLLEDGHEVPAVFTQPDKPVGRHAVLTPPPVKQLALSHGIPVYQPTKMRDGTVAALLRELAPDCLVVVAYGRILPQEILDVPPRGCVNIHGSLLPRYRGAAPIQWSVIRGETVTGVTSMFMDAGMDTGDIIDTLTTPIGENETAGELFERLAPLGARLLSTTLAAIADGTVTRRPQNDAEATMAPMLEKAMGRLDLTRPAQELHNQVRGMNPWPGAFCTAGGKTLKIHETRVAAGSGAPGALLCADPVTVACGEGALQLVTVQPEGKPRMAAEAWLRGARLPQGARLE
ncbi:MAG: methionyl-tRNA formyltransferase [Angelakisella sp.]|nr:methionyl-tRNA formyltransferase [Angelakisella sp.]